MELLREGKTILAFVTVYPGTWKLNLILDVLPSSCFDTFFITETWKGIFYPFIGRIITWYFKSTYI